MTDPNKPDDRRLLSGLKALEMRIAAHIPEHSVHSRTVRLLKRW
jgi:hypothetical protein